MTPLTRYAGLALGPGRPTTLKESYGMPTLTSTTVEVTGLDPEGYQFKITFGYDDIPPAGFLSQIAETMRADGLVPLPLAAPAPPAPPPAPMRPQQVTQYPATAAPQPQYQQAWACPVHGATKIARSDRGIMECKVTSPSYVVGSNEKAWTNKDGETIFFCKHKER